MKNFFRTWIRRIRKQLRNLWFPIKNLICLIFFLMRRLFTPFRKDITNIVNYLYCLFKEIVNDPFEFFNKIVNYIGNLFKRFYQRIKDWYEIYSRMPPLKYRSVYWTVLICIIIYIIWVSFPPASPAFLIKTYIIDKVMPYYIERLPMFIIY